MIGIDRFSAFKFFVTRASSIGTMETIRMLSVNSNIGFGGPKALLLRDISTAPAFMLFTVTFVTYKFCRFGFPALNKISPLSSMNLTLCISGCFAMSIPAILRLINSALKKSLAVVVATLSEIKLPVFSIFWDRSI